MTEKTNTCGSITIAAGEAICEVWPDLGGSIGRWSIAGQDIFRRANGKFTAAKLPLGMASFPLVPYSNRIGFGKFGFKDSSYQLEPNFAPEPHSIHGSGWTSRWQVEATSGNCISLCHDYLPEGGWPWPFQAKQKLKLYNDSLMMELTARNMADEPVPLAFGHHPYFESKGAILSFSAQEIWHTGDDNLPKRPEKPVGQFDFADGARVQGRVLDNGYGQWDGEAQIRWSDQPMLLDIISDMSAAVVYIPEGGDSFCFEPVPHIINALNLPEYGPQMAVVAPGETFKAAIDFQTRPN